MNRDNRVIKASNIYYINSDQPDWLYQIAEEYYLRAQEYEQAYSFLKARAHYQKAEDYFQRARDAYKARKQADKSKKQADEARKQADEARRQAVKEQDGYAPPKATRRIYKSQPAATYQDNPVPPVYPQTVTRRQAPAPPPPPPGLSGASAPIARAKQEEAPKTVDSQSIRHTDELNPQQPLSGQDTLITPEKKANRPISWKGKRHG